MKKIITGEYRDDIRRNIEHYLESKLKEYTNNVTIIIEIIEDNE